MDNKDKKKKNRVSVYLIKENIEESEILKDRGNLPPIQTDYGVIFSSFNKTGNPSWVKGFFKDESILKTNLINSNSRAVFLTTINCDGKERYFAVCFGYGKSMLNADVFEERFGLLVTLNSINIDKIRYLQKKEIGYNQLASKQQVPSLSGIDYFDVNTMTDLINLIAGKSNDIDVADGVILGSDSFCAAIENDISTVQDYLSILYKKFVSLNYKENFDWIGNILPVRSVSLIDKLNNSLIKSISEKEKRFFLAPPDVIEWENFDHFIVPFVRNNVYDIDIDEVFSTRTNITINTLKKQTIKAYSKNNDSMADEWPLYKCLYGQIYFEKREYCIDSGKWYQINKKYADDINKAFEEIPTSNIDFPESKNKIGEPLYNYLMAKTSDDYLRMDNEKIKPKTYSSPVEFCDILKGTDTLICNKMYHSSSALSHLFNQGMVSVELLRSDPDFVTKVNEKIAELLTKDNKIELFPKFEVNHNSIKNVVFGIIGNFKDDRPNIPFFSKVVLQNIYNILKNPYEVQIYIKSASHPK